MLRSSIYCAISIAFLTSLLVPTAARSQQPAPPVGVDTVIREPLRQTTPVVGRLVAVESGTVASRIAERVDVVLVRVGDRIEKSAVLAGLSVDRLEATRALREAELRKSEALVARERATRTQAQQRFNRMVSLRGSTAFRQDRFEEIERDLLAAESAVSQAVADHERARANLSLADTALGDATIVAPYSGVVVARHTVAGDYVRIGDPIVTLLNDQAMEIEADVPALRSRNLSAGMTLDARFADGARISAVVRTVVPEENPRTRTRSVRFQLLPAPTGTGTAFAENQAVTIDIPSGEMRDATTVHKDAIVIMQGQSMVYVVEEGKAAIRPVRTGAASGERFEVLGGLEPGDTVVTRGNERLQPGQPVTPLAPG